MKYCDNCGCRMSGGICSNCHEELYIMEYQADAIDFPLSDEFREAAGRQRREIAIRDSEKELSNG